jgi:hypothetical protein
MRRMKMSTAENEIGERESVCLWAEGKIVFLLLDTMQTCTVQTQTRLSNRALINYATV